MSQSDKEQQEPNQQAVQSASEDAEAKVSDDETVGSAAAAAEAPKNSLNESSSNKKSSGKTRRAPFVFVLILILLAFAGCGYGAYYYLNEQMLEREASFNDGLQRAIQGLSNLESEGRALDRKQADLQRALTAAVAGMENQMTALAERLAASESTGPADWTLAEVEYLLRIANQRLITSRDHQTAIEMLQAADTILKELAYPELAVVRRQLVADITRLQLANQVDTEGVYFALEAMSAEIVGLKHFAPEQLETAEPGLSEETSRWVVLRNRVVQTLSRYIRIETDAGEPEYLVTDDQEVVRALAIQLQIRQAQLALLSGQQDIYTSALLAASGSVQRYYAADNIAARLAELSKRQVQQQAMDVSESIRILSNVVDQLSRTGAEER